MTLRGHYGKSKKKAKNRKNQSGRTQNRFERIENVAGLYFEEWEWYKWMVWLDNLEAEGPCLSKHDQHSRLENCFVVSKESLFGLVTRGVSEAPVVQGITEEVWSSQGWGRRNNPYKHFLPGGCAENWLTPQIVSFQWKHWSMVPEDKKQGGPNCLPK